MRKVKKHRRQQLKIKTAERLSRESVRQKSYKAVMGRSKKRAKIKYPVNAELPPISLLDPPRPSASSGNDAEAMGAELMKKLREFGVVATLLSIVVEANRASASMLQQRMGIGYNHASRIMHLFEKRGVIGPARGAGPREVLVNK